MSFQVNANANARILESVDTTTTSRSLAMMPGRTSIPGLFVSTMLLRQRLTSEAWVPIARCALSKRLGSLPLFSSTASSQVDLAHRLDGLDQPTVWHEFSPLAVKHGAVNLGQGFPDWDPPLFVQEAMKRAIDPAAGRHANQYARSYAHMPLARVLADDYGRKWNREIDPATDIGTAVGCTNALYCVLQGLLNPGDEVLLLEPAFDIYSSQVLMAGGRPIYCPLRPVLPDNDDDSSEDTRDASQIFTLDLDELRASLTSRTKVLLLNTPHNPTGKMFSKQELEGIAAIVHDFPNLTVISDEVYEHLVFDGAEHISMASLPGMWDRTLTLSSTGKTFSCTGWKVGWAIGPAHLTKAMTAVQQWVNFSAPTPNQDAIAMALQQAVEPYEGYESYYTWLAAEYKRKRGILASALKSAGMRPILPNGAFFIMADTSPIRDCLPPSYLEEVTLAMPATPMPRDWATSRWMTQEVGVTAIPPSAFYSPPNVPLAANFLRFAFCKTDDTLWEAHRRLEKYFSS